MVALFQRRRILHTLRFACACTFYCLNWYPYGGLTHHLLQLQSCLGVSSNTCHLRNINTHRVYRAKQWPHCQKVQHLNTS